MNVIFPMTGPNKFTSDDYTYPKPLIDVFGKTMLETAFDTYRELENVRFLPIISSSDAKEFNIDSVISRILDGSSFKTILHEGKTAGALCTSLLAIDELDEDDELIIANYDQNISFDIQECIDKYRAKDADFGIVCFDSVHPKWSYAKTDDHDLIIEVAEKKPISRNAMVGFYYFKNAGLFVQAAMKTMLTASSDKNSFFISECLNQLVLMGALGSMVKVDKNQYRNFYDASELKEFLHESAGENYKKAVVELTKKYVRAFDEKDISTVSDMLIEDAVLYDPNVGEIKGKQNVTDFVQKLFNDTSSLSFTARSIIADRDKACLEFVLLLDKTIVNGVDVITWNKEKIEKIYAYLEVK
ncbi:nuclear transport factor 2 family protein [Rhodanobacter aciditrophus]|uniref:Nuclear transport factor 2 family protein n=1 Tax=Rhodanobacter aciditrophus TaxID=1623218 RepID=A0ABW4B1S8_9GAMM